MYAPLRSSLPESWAAEPQSINWTLLGNDGHCCWAHIVVSLHIMVTVLPSRLLSLCITRDLLISRGFCNRCMIKSGGGATYRETKEREREKKKYREREREKIDQYLVKLITFYNYLCRSRHINLHGKPFAPLTMAEEEVQGF